jgi:hypothetical protein
VANIVEFFNLGGGVRRNLGRAVSALARTLSVGQWHGRRKIKVIGIRCEAICMCTGYKQESLLCFFRGDSCLDRGKSQKIIIEASSTASTNGLEGLRKDVS